MLAKHLKSAAHILKHQKKIIIHHHTTKTTMKTLNQLQKNVSFFFSGYGHNKISIIYRGKEYRCTSSNTIATDRIKDDNEGIDNDTYYKTKKEAYLSLYNEVKAANNLK